MQNQKDTGASFLLDELVDENTNSNSMNCLSSDKEIIMIVDNCTKENERSHAGDNGQESFNLGWLPTKP